MKKIFLTFATITSLLVTGCTKKNNPQPPITKINPHTSPQRIFKLGDTVIWLNYHSTIQHPNKPMVIVAIYNPGIATPEILEMNDYWNMLWVAPVDEVIHYTH